MRRTQWQDLRKRIRPSMPIRSMTGYAQVRGEVREELRGEVEPNNGKTTTASPLGVKQGASNGRLGFALSLKSVNHRFLDLHFRLPSGTDSLEMQLRRLLKEKIARGHVEVTLSLERSSSETFALNRELVGGYITAFRAAAAEFSLATERELRQRMAHLVEAGKSVKQHRRAVLQNYIERLQSRIQELLGATADKERVLQEAALLVDRSDIQEEIVRLETHVQHFLGLLDEGGEIGKKLDFLLQEMNREANTLLSKTSGLAGEALNITEAGLAMKAEIEKSREQVQNLE